MSEGVDQRVLERIDKLSEAGRALLNESRSVSNANRGRLVRRAMFIAWRAQCLAFLKELLGDKHVYVKQFETWVSMTAPLETTTTVVVMGPMSLEEAIPFGLALLFAVGDDVRSGYLTSYKELIHAEVFSDFLFTAEYLLDGGYKDAAAVIIGGVLEQHLRQLCVKHTIPIEVATAKGSHTLSAADMNTELCKKQVYNQAEQKQVTAWLGIRNYAAHAQWGEYSEHQVVLMLQGIRNFMTAHSA